MRDALRIAAGLVLAVTLLVILIVALGPQRIAVALRGADVRVYALAFPVAVVTLFAWAEVSATLFGAVDGDLDRAEFYETYLTGVFAKAVMPGGNVGGVGVITYVVSRRSALPFERLLVAMSAAEFANNAAAVSVATAGLAYVLLAPSTGTPGGSTASGVGAIAIAIVALGLLLVYAMLVRFGTAETLVEKGAGGLRATLGRVSDRVANALSPAAVEQRLDSFSETIETIRTDRGSLVRALAFSHLGWLLFATPLYLSLWAVGARVGYPVVLFVLPIAGLAGVVSTPGGLGAVDGAIAGLLLLVTGYDPGKIGAATFLFRVSTYGLTVVLTGTLTIYASIGADTGLLATFGIGGSPKKPGGGGGGEQQTRSGD